MIGGMSVHCRFFRLVLFVLHKLLKSRNCMNSVSAISGYLLLNSCYSLPDRAAYPAGLKTTNYCLKICGGDL